MQIYIYFQQILHIYQLFYLIQILKRSLLNNHELHVIEFHQNYII